MKYRTIGRSGIRASVVGLGTWSISGWMWGGTDEENSIKTIHASIDAGINLIDSAPAYGVGLAEQIVAKAIRDRRDKVVLATKCGLVWHTNEGTYHEVQYGKQVYRFLGPQSIRHELEESLQRLGTDYVDLYQTHWQDETTPIEDTVDELIHLKQEGKVRAVGVSNVSLAQLERYHTLGPVDSVQEEYNMLNRDLEASLLPFCQANDIAVLAYSPLAQGLLTGRISPDRQFPEGDFRRNHARFSHENRMKVTALLMSIEPIAHDHGVSLAHVAIAWTISSMLATHALVGARSPEQARESAVAGELELDEGELSFINQQVERYAADIPHLL
ncbi:MAG: aldo/keto reductase [Terriglobia bacterium]|jgi:methylglyoxal reductase